ncbi:hypothetical protein THRCLA_06354 [Thraustotheca clavata]|uniref:J domain-containing protein n=1 Tax=Thraustotheca clavata TaxID=74557 RepID=A0A1V9ZPF2_9STRA|nr:hypothetical protein THRCLA_06354 [Thraustotheca clavata]
MKFGAESDGRVNLVEYSDSSTEGQEEEEFVKERVKMASFDAFSGQNEPPMFAFGKSEKKKSKARRRPAKNVSQMDQEPRNAWSNQFTSSFEASMHDGNQVPPTTFEFNVPENNRVPTKETQIPSFVQEEPMHTLFMPEPTTNPFMPEPQLNPFIPDIKKSKTRSARRKRAEKKGPAKKDTETFLHEDHSMDENPPSPDQNGTSSYTQDQNPFEFYPFKTPHNTAQQHQAEEETIPTSQIDEDFIDQFQDFYVDQKPVVQNPEQIRLCAVHKITVKAFTESRYTATCTCCQDQFDTIIDDIHLCPACSEVGDICPIRSCRNPLDIDPWIPASTQKFAVGKAPKKTKSRRRRVLKTAPSENGATPSFSEANTPPKAQKEELPQVPPPPVEPEWIQSKREGGLAYQHKDYRGAIDHYSAGLLSLANEPRFDYAVCEHAKMLANRAAAWMMLKKIREALQDAEAAMVLDPTYIRAHLRCARCHLLLGDYKQSRSIFVGLYEILKQENHTGIYLSQTNDGIKDGQSFLSAVNEAKWCMTVSDHTNALRHTTTALVYAPYSRELHLQKMKLFLALKQYTTAISHMKAELKVHYSIVAMGIDIGLLYAQSYHYLDETDNAENVLEELEIAAPTSRDVLRVKQLWQDMKQAKAMGNECFGYGNYERAVLFYSAGLGLDAQHDAYNAVLYCNRAAALMHMDKHIEALADCKDALKRNPNYHRALLRQARCNVALKQYDKAIADFDAYIAVVESTVSKKELHGIKVEREGAMRLSSAEKAKAKQNNHRSRHQRYSSDWEDYYFRSTYNNNSRCRKKVVPTHPKTHYEILQVPSNASVEEIKKSYRKLALKHHPDKAKDLNDASLFKDMTAAYAVLSDPPAKAKYDRQLRYGFDY